MRTVALFVTLVNNSKGFRPLTRLLKSSKVKILDLLLLIIADIEQASPNLVQLVRDFEYDTEDELFDSEEEARSFYNKPEVYNDLLEGNVGMNLIQHYTARAFSSAMEDLCEFAFSRARILLEKEKSLIQSELMHFEEIKGYSKGLSHNLLGVNRLEEAPELDFHWDIKTWANNLENLPPSNFKLQNATKIRFSITPHQFKMVEDNLNRFGHTPHGRAKTLIRTTLDHLWRTPEVVN